jgi:hypothetical protein
MQGSIQRRSALFGLLAFAGSVAVGAPCFAGESRRLFHIGRSKNANIVSYDVRIDRKGKLIQSDPIDAYWRLFAEDGRREELSFFERKLAYGYSAERVSAEGFELRLSAFDRRPVYVRRKDGRYRAEMPIGGRKARLERLFVQSTDGVVPSVQSVDLFGTDLETGARVRERLLPG